MRQAGKIAGHIHVVDGRRSAWRRLGWGTLGSCVAALALLSPADVHACGGCFGPMGTLSEVTGHRMAFAISDERTVLWDQFEYNGDPADFSWVLPVAPGSYLEAAEQAFFDALEQQTATIVQAPPLSCASADEGCATLGGQADSASELSGAFSNPDAVQVLSRATVGPYQTVTLRSNQPDALSKWLTVNGYVVPTAIEPVIDAYVAEGADFIALKLAPDKGVSQMTPVRVVTPGGDPVLPLRMIAAGAAAEVNIVLYVIGEGRFTIADLKPVEVDAKDVTWDFASMTSDYATVRAQALKGDGGRRVLTTFAGGDSLRSVAFSYANPFGAAPSFGGNPSNTGAAPRCVVPSGPPSLFEETRVVTDPCYGASEVQANITCGPPSESDLASARFKCGASTDIAAALVGLRPDRTWVTRLEMRLPKAALDMDTLLEKTENTQLSRTMTAGKFEGPRPCDPPVFTASVASRRRVPYGLAVLGLAATLVLVRRSWVRRKESRA